MKLLNFLKISIKSKQTSIKTMYKYMRLLIKIKIGNLNSTIRVHF